MRWVMVAILGYACLVAETTVFRRSGLLALEIHGHWVRPDLLLVFGVFLALVLEPWEVFVAGWCLGLATDLTAPYGRLGIGALLLAVGLWTLSQLQGSLFRTRVVTQFILTLLVVFTLHWLGETAAQASMGVAPLVSRNAEGALFDAVYSAVLAPYLFWIFFRFRAPLRLPPGVAGE